MALEKEKNESLQQSDSTPKKELEDQVHLLSREKGGQEQSILLAKERYQVIKTD